MVGSDTGAGGASLQPYLVKGRYSTGTAAATDCQRTVCNNRYSASCGVARVAVGDPAGSGQGTGVEDVDITGHSAIGSCQDTYLGLQRGPRGAKTGPDATKG